MKLSITLATYALSLISSATYGALPSFDEINTIKKQLAQEQSRRSALSSAEQKSLASLFQGLGNTGDIPLSMLPTLSYDVLNLSEGDAQANVDKWMALSGLDGVIHRSSMGIDGKDKAYAQRCANAASASYLWGAYHFLRQQGSGEDQAKWFIKTISEIPNHPARVLLIVDAEYLRDSSSPHPTVRQVIECADTIHKLTGVYPGIYTGQNFLWEQFNKTGYDAAAKNALDNTWLWIARYSDSRTKLIFPEVSSPPWQKWTLWQVGDKDNKSPMVDSIPAEINIFKGTPEQLVKFWNAHSWNYSPPSPAS